jgi:hypothetical protein
MLPRKSDRGFWATIVQALVRPFIIVRAQMTFEVEVSCECAPTSRDCHQYESPKRHRQTHLGIGIHRHSFSDSHLPPLSPYLSLSSWRPASWSWERWVQHCAIGEPGHHPACPFSVSHTMSLGKRPTVREKQSGLMMPKSDGNGSVRGTEEAMSRHSLLSN